ncbi:hypothetical protein E4U56_008141 [Claviceps arundinis]|uniref:Uncharacterized protein n=1 Tax=Claviceps arundinis TaxID=1623583 RepID=A0A9P7N1R1_9HYPO|nr:hypothetical protein E4U56_008141 [Claviceps arundinis]
MSAAARLRFKATHHRRSNKGDRQMAKWDRALVATTDFLIQQSVRQCEEEDRTRRSIDEMVLESSSEEDQTVLNQELHRLVASNAGRWLGLDACLLETKWLRKCEEITRYFKLSKGVIGTAM